MKNVNAFFNSVYPWSSIIMKVLKSLGKGHYIKTQYIFNIWSIISAKSALKSKFNLK